MLMVALLLAVVGITLVPEFRGNFIATRKFYQTSKVIFISVPFFSFF